MFPYTTTQDSQHEDQKVQKKAATKPRDKPFTRHSFRVPRARGQHKT